VTLKDENGLDKLASWT